MSIVFVAVGLPGLGKSYIREKTISNLSAEDATRVFVYSPDDRIEEIAKLNDTTYDSVWALSVNDATKALNAEVKRAIEENKIVYWDQTNLTAKKRRQIISMFPKNYKKVCVRVLTPISPDEVAEWNRRLINRPGKTIPHHVMWSMRNSFQNPTMEEGWDEIRTMDMYGIEQQGK